LVLGEFGLHFGAASLGALFLGYGIVSADGVGRQTSLAGIGAFVYTLHFPTTAAVEEGVSLEGRTWGERGCFGDSPIAGYLRENGDITGRAGDGVGGHDGLASGKRNDCPIYLTSCSGH
jgi:hypothetical protein